MIDCCGSLAVTGVNAASLDAFNVDAAGCFEAICDCLSQPTVADDGSTEEFGTELFVNCFTGTCGAFFFLE